MHQQDTSSTMLTPIFADARRRMVATILRWRRSPAIRVPTLFRTIGAGGFRLGQAPSDRVDGVAILDNGPRSTVRGRPTVSYADGPISMS